uniref:Ribosomal protein 3 n=1 Tax=Lonomia obliqua TaxID=304329 RepID=Q5MGJ9_LONON|nr:ribosomal protein 3 [Lonomia obliqua]
MAVMEDRHYCGKCHSTMVFKDDDNRLSPLSLKDSRPLCMMDF